MFTIKEIPDTSDAELQSAAVMLLEYVSDTRSVRVDRFWMMAATLLMQMRDQAEVNAQLVEANNGLATRVAALESMVNGGGGDYGLPAPN